MAFYRTYRPQVFDEIDNGHVRDQLVSFLSKDKKELPHAFLFTGPKGSGKTTAARLIAKLFTCTKPTKSGAPCGKCDACVSVAEGRAIDILELDAASNRGIDEIRTLRDTIALAPSHGAYKIYIIDEVHMLTTEACNALLKTLEEPPAHTVFILATTDPQKMPATIISRCVHIHFSKASVEDLVHALSRIVNEEKIPINDDALTLIAQHADGAFRDAVKFLEHVSFQKGKITVDVVRNLLLLTDTKLVDAFVLFLKERDCKEALHLVDILVTQGKDIKAFLVSLLTRFEGDLVAVAGEVKDASVFTSEELRELIRRFTTSYSEMKLSPIAQLPMELAIIEFCETQDRSEHLVTKNTKEERTEITKEDKDDSADSDHSSGLLTLDKLTDHWKDFIESTKPYNHSVAGVLRSTRPKAVGHGIVTIEAFYPFHQEKLSETKIKEALGLILKKLFGEKVKVEIILGKK